MASIVKDEPNARRLRDISLELSRMGMDDELLRDVLMKARERRTRTHPSPTPQPIGSNRVGLGHGAEKKHAPLNAVQTKRHSAGMHAKSRQTHLFRDGSLNKNKASGRTAAFPKQRNSESFGSIYSLHLSNRTREDQVSVSPNIQSMQSANFKTSRAQKRRPYLEEDTSMALGRPGASFSVGSGSNGSSNPTPASRAHFASTADKKGASKPSGFQSTLNSNAKKEGHGRAVYATKQVGANEISSRLSLHSRSTARNEQVSKPVGYQSTLNPKMRKEGHAPPRRAKQLGASNEFASNFPLHSKVTSSNEQVSKLARNHSKLNPRITKEGQVLTGSLANQDGSSLIGSDTSLHSKSAKRSKAFGILSLFQRQTSRQRHASTERVLVKQGGSSARGSNSSLRSLSTTRTNQSQKSCGTQSKAHAIRKEGVTREIPGTSAAITSLSSALSNNSHASFAPGGSKTIASNSSRLSKGTATSKQTYKSRGIQSKSQSIRKEGVTRKSPETSTSIRESRKALSPQECASRMASTNSSSNGRDASRSGLRAHEEPAEASSPRDLAVFLREKGSRGRCDSTGDSVSTLSFPSTSTTPTRNSILASDYIYPVYPGGKCGSQDGDEDNSSGDDSNEGSHLTSSELGKVVDSIRSTARDILSSDVEDAWLSRAVLKGIAESKKVSVDDLIESVCDKLDELDDSLFNFDGSKKGPRKRWLPRLQFSVKW